MASLLSPLLLFPCLFLIANAQQPAEICSNSNGEQALANCCPAADNQVVRFSGVDFMLHCSGSLDFAPVVEADNLKTCAESCSDQTCLGSYLDDSGICYKVESVTKPDQAAVVRAQVSIRTSTETTTETTTTTATTTETTTTTTTTTKIITECPAPPPPPPPQPEKESYGVCGYPYKIYTVNGVRYAAYHGCDGIGPNFGTINVASEYECIQEMEKRGSSMVGGRYQPWYTGIPYGYESKPHWCQMNDKLLDHPEKNERTTTYSFFRRL